MGNKLWQYPRREDSGSVAITVKINVVLKTDQYPLPKPEEIFAMLVGDSKFTELDLS